MPASRFEGWAGRFGVPPTFAGAILATLALALPALGAALSPAATGWTTFDRARVADGDLWRIVTCHWTHWSLEHLAWDLFAFAVLVPSCWRVGARRTVTVIALSSLLIPAAVWVWLPRMVEYRGLSGLDSALFVFLAASLLQREVAARDRRMVVWLALALLAFVAKLGFELTTGATLFVSDPGFTPVPLAHVAGGACGVLCALGMGRGDAWPRRRTADHASFSFRTVAIDR